MIYNGLELGTFFEIPWDSPCYQVLRGINPILQMVFTFSQMYFVFMNARVRIKAVLLPFPIITHFIRALITKNDSWTNELAEGRIRLDDPFTSWFIRLAD